MNSNMLPQKRSTPPRTLGVNTKKIRVMSGPTSIDAQSLVQFPQAYGHRYRMIVIDDSQSAPQTPNPSLTLSTPTQFRCTTTTLHQQQRLQQQKQTRLLQRQQRVLAYQAQMRQHLALRQRQLQQQQQQLQRQHKQLLLQQQQFKQQQFKQPQRKQLRHPQQQARQHKPDQTGTVTQDQSTSSLQSTTPDDITIVGSASGSASDFFEGNQVGSLSSDKSCSNTSNTTPPETSDLTSAVVGAISGTSSKHIRSRKHLISLENRPAKRARFEVTSSMEIILYDDIMCVILSFLSLENLSSSMRVSQKFARNVQKARRNMTTLVVDWESNIEEYTKTVLENCGKVKKIVLEQSALSKEQIYTILDHCADTVVYINSIQVGAFCSEVTTCHYKYTPITCRDCFLDYLTKTFKNLRSIAWAGCLRMDEFLRFTGSYRSLELCGLGIPFTAHGVNANDVQKGLKTLFCRNPNLNCLVLSRFVGVGEIILKMTERPPLTELCLYYCKTSPQTGKRLQREFPGVKFDMSEVKINS